MAIYEVSWSEGSNGSSIALFHPSWWNRRFWLQSLQVDHLILGSPFGAKLKSGIVPGWPSWETFRNISTKLNNIDPDESGNFMFFFVVFGFFTQLGSLGNHLQPIYSWDGLRLSAWADGSESGNPGGVSTGGSTWCFTDLSGQETIHHKFTEIQVS